MTGLGRSALACLLLVGVAAASASVAAEKRPPITAAEAKEHVGKRVTVCGHVAGIAQFLARSGKSYLLYIDAPAPNHAFTVIIPGTVQDNPFTMGGDPLKRYTNKDLCVTGNVKEKNGAVFMQPNHPAEIKVTEPAGK